MLFLKVLREKDIHVKCNELIQMTQIRCFALGSKSQSLFSQSGAVLGLHLKE